jgi:hypothetical protein
MVSKANHLTIGENSSRLASESIATPAPCIFGLWEILRSAQNDKVRKRQSLTIQPCRLRFKTGATVRFDVRKNQKR